MYIYYDKEYEGMFTVLHKNPSYPHQQFFYYLGNYRIQLSPLQDNFW